MPWPPIVNRDFYPANWSVSRGGRAICAIVAHGTVGTDSRAYLQRGGDKPDGSDRQVSIHVLIARDGTIYRMVDDGRGANHAGFGTMPKGMPQVNPNLVTLGFELESLQRGTPDDYAEQQLLAMGSMINAWRDAFGPLPILRHADIDPTRRRDPVGLSVAQIEQWAQRAAQMSAPAPAAPVADGLPTPLPYVGTTQTIRAATFKAVLVDHQSPLAPWSDILYRWCVDVDIAADVALGQCHAESNFGKDEPARSLGNCFNLKERFGFLSNADGFSDFFGPTKAGGHWLGWRWGLDHLKRMPTRGLYTLEQIAPMFVYGDPQADASVYIRKIRATVADIRKRER